MKLIYKLTLALNTYYYAKKIIWIYFMEKFPCLKQLRETGNRKCSFTYLQSEMKIQENLPGNYRKNRPQTHGNTYGIIDQKCRKDKEL